MTIFLSIIKDAKVVDFGVFSDHRAIFKAKISLRKKRFSIVTTNIHWDCFNKMIHK